MKGLQFTEIKNCNKILNWKKITYIYHYVYHDFLCLYLWAIRVVHVTQLVDITLIKHFSISSSYRESIKKKLFQKIRKHDSI